jgi:hypothetical protein
MFLQRGHTQRKVSGTRELIREKRERERERETEGRRNRCRERLGLEL